ncbi:flagellar biosynthesis protein FlhB [Oscillospiraceae bacterium OttesenSCG-928-G22]|nr:flagellar biosynthesis protein FlhB [Oscillospiraceae bacterium OttesenSCG-928-G22]
MAQSGDKTEKATPKKRRDARSEGNVLKSQDMNTAIAIVAMFGTLAIMMGYLGDKITSILKQFLSGSVITSNTIGPVEISTALRHAFTEFFLTIAPILLVAIVIGIASNVLQVGFLFTTKVLQPKLSKINPLQGFKRIFSMKSLVELLKSIIKISVFAFIVYQQYMKNFESLPTLMGYDIGASMVKILTMCKDVAFQCAIAFVAIGAVDYLYQWWSYEKNLKMTKQEVKDEYKNIEGDPQIKGKIKQKQREMSQMRMMQAIPQADVVITNPTHFAVALKYDEATSRAPVVIAKGKDLVAQRIKAVAKESGVELVENKPVAQALFFSVELGDEIPEALFKAVAEILAYIFKNKKNAAARAERERLSESVASLFR